MMFLFLIFLVFPVAWLVSEFKAKPLARISLGLVAMAVVGLVSAQVALLKPQSENKYLHDSLVRIHDLLRQGRADRIEKGFSAYSDEIKTGRGSYRACQEMWGELSGPDGK
jgi:hypothetical protein